MRRNFDYDARTLSLKRYLILTLLEKNSRALFDGDIFSLSSAINQQPLDSNRVSNSKWKPCNYVKTETMKDIAPPQWPQELEQFFGSPCRESKLIFPHFFKQSPLSFHGMMFINMARQVKGESEKIAVLWKIIKIWFWLLFFEFSAFFGWQSLAHETINLKRIILFSVRADLLCRNWKNK